MPVHVSVCPSGIPPARGTGLGSARQRGCSLAGEDCKDFVKIEGREKNSTGALHPCPAVLRLSGFWEAQEIKMRRVAHLPEHPPAPESVPPGKAGRFQGIWVVFALNTLNRSPPGTNVGAIWPSGCLCLN